MKPCANCHRDVPVTLYRVFTIGPRWFCVDCVASLRAIGLDAEPERRSVPRWRERDLTRDLTGVGR